MKSGLMLRVAVVLPLAVFATEPLPEDSPLWECENCLITAHNADLTDDYWELGWQTFVSNAEAFRAGEPLVTPVDKEEGY